ncbi:MAG: TonB-dependent receptor [Bacteroidota bacterium]
MRRLDLERIRINTSLRKIWFVITLLLLVVSSMNAQTTGKISGKILDDQTGEPLIGVNVIIEGTRLGSSSDINGDFYIINIPPGTYRVKISMVGYETKIVQNVVVSVNRTTNVDAELKETMVQGQEVVVTADRITTKKDQTSSIRNVNSDQIKMLPVENIDAVVQMQAGVVAGHFRGGRLDEVSYLVDGLYVDEASGRSRAVRVEKEVVSEIEVITGTFNAEYGNAMSGIVNVVTKDAGNDFHASATLSSSNFYTSNKDIFFGLEDSDFFRTKDYQLYLEAPIVKDLLSVFVNGRFQDIKDQYHGIKRFNPDNYSNFLNEDASLWYSEHTGDSSIVPMGTSKDFSLFTKLSFKPVTSIRSSLTYSLNKADSKWYSHYWKYNPDGRSTNHTRTDMVAFQLNHTLSNDLFYEFKLSYLRNSDGTYVFEDSYDARYIHDEYSINTGAGFSTGGQDKNYYKRLSQDISAKFDATWQLNKNHILKSGFLYTKHDIDLFNAQIKNKYEGTADEYAYIIDSVTNKRVYLYYEPTLVTDESIYSDIYRVYPVEFSLYLQDKIEYDYMVINCGLRYDYFDPAATYPSQLRNPANQLSYPDNPEYMSTYPKANPNSQLSPRFGISYQLGEMALLRFSYGHFFQMPPLYALYTNSQHIVGVEDYTTTMGNPLVKPQKTIQYEVGLWQQLVKGMSIEVAVFYRDIYDLLSTRIITTFNQVRYGLYSNKDYGNARGLELKYDFFSEPISATINYTLQYTKGNADNPIFNFSRAGSNMDPVSVLIPMSWDQRHTLNFSVGYNSRLYGATISAYFNSGTPYTWSPITGSTLYDLNLLPNNSKKPSQFSVDLSAFYTLWTSGSQQIKLTMLVYNLLDALNEVSVYSRTGRAYTDVILDTELSSHRSNFNDYYDVIHDPSMYSAPRSIKFGITFTY